MTLDLSSLTVDTEFGDLGLGEVCALVESLTGEFEPILLPGDPVGHVGHGCHPTIVSLQTEAHMTVQLGDRQPCFLALSFLGKRGGKKKKSGKKTTHRALSWRIQMAN